MWTDHQTEAVTCSTTQTLPYKLVIDESISDSSSRT
jgi:hypothetical protein